MTLFCHDGRVSAMYLLLAKWEGMGRLYTSARARQAPEDTMIMKVASFMPSQMEQSGIESERRPLFGRIMRITIPYLRVKRV